MKTIDHVLILAERFEKMASEVPFKSRKQAAKWVLELLADMYGGEGWDDPRLIEITEKWVGFPASWEDQVIDPVKEAEELAEQSFDPRSFLDENPYAH
jgi:hypothetical protein